MQEAGFFTEEGARIAKVQRKFVFIRYAESAVIVITALTSLAVNYRFSITDVALALLIHAAVLLAFDVIAERRGATYLSEIERRSVGT